MFIAITHLTRLIQKRDRLSRQQLGILLEEITSKGVLRHILSEVPTKRSMLIGEQLPTNNQWMILCLQNPKTMVTSFSGGRSPKRTTDHGQVTGKLYHLRLRVECTIFCNLQIRARTHAVLARGLYELLGNPTT